MKKVKSFYKSKIPVVISSRGRITSGIGIFLIETSATTRVALTQKCSLLRTAKIVRKELDVYKPNSNSLSKTLILNVEHSCTP